MSAVLRPSVAQTNKCTSIGLIDWHTACRQLPASATEASDDGDEPEAAVLLIACGIGLLTGSGVVLFNVAVHAIQASDCCRHIAPLT